MKFFAIAMSLLILTGCNMKAAIEKQSAKAAQERAENPDPAPAPPKHEEPPRSKGIIGKMTDDIEEYQVAMKDNPKLIEVEVKASGNDYLSFVTSAAVNTTARVSMLGMEQQINVIKQVEGRNPSYVEIMKIMKDNHIKFSMLPRYRLYTYDAKRGAFVILEDPDLKAEMHKG